MAYPLQALLYISVLKWRLVISLSSYSKYSKMVAEEYFYQSQ